MKETKNVLTRASCQDRLIEWEKGEVFSAAALLAVMLVIFCPLLALSLYVERQVPVLGILLSLPCTLAPLAFVYRLTRGIHALRI